MKCQFYKPPPYLACHVTSNTMDPSVPTSFIEKTQEQ
jgi:hypothetical protein